MLVLFFTTMVTIGKQRKTDEINLLYDMEEKAACVQQEGLQSIIDMQLKARKEDREHESRMTEMMLKTLEQVIRV